MRISDVLRSKGETPVVTVSSSDTVARLLEVLSEHRIGAVVVTDDDGSSIAGIVSERDIVRSLVGNRAAFDQPVTAIMTSDVHTCTSETSLEDLAEEMTAHRFRHVPVVQDGRLVSIVSIGDVVKYRIEALKTERDHLVGYINQ